jgi:hypothetical protein
LVLRDLLHLIPDIPKVIDTIRESCEIRNTFTQGLKVVVEHPLPIDDIFDVQSKFRVVKAELIKNGWVGATSFVEFFDDVAQGAKLIINELYRFARLIVQTAQIKEQFVHNPLSILAENNGLVVMIHFYNLHSLSTEDTGKSTQEWQLTNGWKELRDGLPNGLLYCLPCFECDLSFFAGGSSCIEIGASSLTWPLIRIDCPKPLMLVA